MQPTAVTQHRVNNGTDRSTRGPNDLSIRSAESRTSSAVKERRQ